MNKKRKPSSYPYKRILELTQESIEKTALEIKEHRRHIRQKNKELKQLIEVEHNLINTLNRQTDLVTK